VQSSRSYRNDLRRNTASYAEKRRSVLASVYDGDGIEVYPRPTRYLVGL